MLMWRIVFWAALLVFVAGMVLMLTGNAEATGYDPEVFCRAADARREDTSRWKYPPMPQKPNETYNICMAQERNAFARTLRVVKNGWATTQEFEACRLRIDSPSMQWGLVAMEACVMQAARMRYNGLTQ